MAESPTTTPQSADINWAQRGIAIGSLILAVFAPVVGLVGSIVSFVWAKRISASTTIPVWGIIVSIVVIILGIIAGIISFIVLSNAINAGALDIEALCTHRDQWGWLLDSLRYVCR